MRFYRDDFTVEVRGDTVRYASKRFSILIEKKRELTPLERDLLRWAFGGKGLPFVVGDDERVVYSGVTRPLLKVEEVPEFFKKNYRYVEVNGERFRVYRDFIDGDYVMPGKDTVVVWTFQGVPRYIRFYGRGIRLYVRSFENVPEFMMEFMRSRDAGVLERYLPFGDELLLELEVWNNRSVFRFTYRGPEYSVMTADLAMDNAEGVLRGVGVFRNGVVRLAVPFGELAGLGENLSFGLVPEDYVEEWILSYPPLKDDVRVRPQITSQGVEIRFEAGDYWDRREVWFDGRYSHFRAGGKKKRASKKALVKYLREAGMVG